MGNVIGLDGREVDPLEESIRGSFYSQGHARARISTLDVTVARWRSAARRVGRQLQRPVRTLEAGEFVHAVLNDWPHDARERSIHSVNLRRAVLGASETVAVRE